MSRILQGALLLTAYCSLLTLVGGCRTSLSPVKNRIGVGVESYVFFDAAGENEQGDIFVGSASGGKVFQVTFSRAHEFGPAVSPDGSMLAFIRGPAAADSARHEVWVMNLYNGSERKLPLAAGAHPQKVAWSSDGGSLYVRTSRGIFVTPAPPARPAVTLIDGSATGTADSALSVPLGDPVIALAGPCDSGDGICVRAPSGTIQLLSQAGRSAFRWGPDSVGYFVGEMVEVRPLAGGTTRQLSWAGMPAGPRSATQFPGRPPAPAP